MPITDPFTGTTYKSWEDVEKDMDNHPGCKLKIKLFVANQLRLGITFTDKQQIMDLIHHLCGQWGTHNPEEFIAKFNDMMENDIGRLIQDIDKILKKRKKRLEILQNYLTQEQRTK